MAGAFNPITPVKPRAHQSRTTPKNKKKKYSFAFYGIAPSQYKVPQMLQELDISQGTWVDIQHDVATN
jgi:hypothetical protein